MMFVMDNVVGTCNLLNYARLSGQLERFLFFGTDEVFGPAPPGVYYKEWDRYKPGNPYAASKSGAEDLCVAYHNTYGLPIIIAHTMNVFGERQAPEKYLPLCIRKTLNGEMISVHANKERTKAGSRFYIHARNVSAAVLFLLNTAENGDKYNIVGEKEVNNEDLLLEIAGTIGKHPRYELTDFHSSRPGHDLRYALDGSKMADMGWKLPIDFEHSLARTVRWYLNHPEWL